MKKFTSLFALGSALFCLAPEQISAQITSVNARITDSVYSYCSLPNDADFYLYADLTGSTPSMFDSLSFNVNFGDGTDSTIKGPMYLKSGTGYGSGFIKHIYTLPGSFTTRVIVTAPSGVKDTAYGTPFTLTNTCGSISGKLFVDKNGNCSKDVGEDDLYWTPIVAINTATSDTLNAGWTDYAGDYSISLLPGTYTIIPNYYYSTPGLSVANPLASPTCPTSGTYSITVAASGTYTKDFAYTCGSISSYDAKTIVSGGCFFPGDTTSITVWGGSWAWYYHYSCLATGLSTSVTVDLDPSLIYIGCFSGLTPTISGSKLTYTLSTAADLDRFYSSIVVQTPTSATIGDTIRIKSYMAPISSITDPNLANNTFNYKKAVVSSYDPNVKEVAPLGYGKEGFIAKNEEMIYTIHFQNTGTAAARNVTITDKIDGNLDINSIHFLGATHNANLYKEGDNIKFRFEGINLPDSGTNYKGSMGSVTYAIRQKKDLAPGTKMENTAAIYFDYNSPIITNTTLNTIQYPTSIENVSLGNDLVKVFPNPANNALNVKMQNTKTFSVLMMDMLGRLVVTQSTDNGELNMNTSSLNNGLYLIHISDDKGNETSKKVQIKH